VTALGLAASIAFCARLLPQPVRLIRTGVPDGVSPLTLMNMALSELAWLGYGLAAGLVPVWAVSVPSVIIEVWTVVLLWRQITRRDVLGAGLWLAVILAATAVGGLGAVLALAVFVNYGPQLWTALRNDDLDGLAPGTWWMGIVDASLWGAYGLVVHDPGVIGYGVTFMAVSITILVRIAQTRRSAALLPAPA